MESFLDTQSLSTAASSSTPHTPSPSMNESTTVDYGYEQSAGPGHYYLDYQNQQQQHHTHGQQHQHPPMLSIEISHPSATAGPLYRRASFPFVQHDHSMSHYPKYANNDQLDPESNGSHHQDRHYSEYDDPVELDHHSSAMVVPTQIPQTAHHQQHPHAFYRPSSSSSSVSSVSAPPGFLNPAMSSIPVMHTDDAASKETQYLRRKCFNCGTTEPPSWRRSTLNPGKIVSCFPPHTPCHFSYAFLIHSVSRYATNAVSMNVHTTSPVHINSDCAQATRPVSNPRHSSNSSNQTASSRVSHPPRLAPNAMHFR
jgi:hypothetical protein